MPSTEPDNPPPERSVRPLVVPAVPPLVVLPPGMGALPGLRVLPVERALDPVIYFYAWLYDGEDPPRAELAYVGRAADLLSRRAENLRAFRRQGVRPPDLTFYLHAPAEHSPRIEDALIYMLRPALNRPRLRQLSAAHEHALSLIGVRLA